MISNDSPDRVRRRGAGRAGREIGTARTKPDRDLSGRQVDDGRGNEERRDAAGTAVDELEVLALDRAEPADARRDEDADAVGVLRRDLEPGVADGELGRRDRELDEDVHLLDVLPVDVLQRVEPLDLTRDARREVLRVEVRDRADPAPAGQQSPPSSPRCRCRPRKSSRRR